MVKEYLEMEMQENSSQLPIIEIKPENVILEEVKKVENMEESRYPEVTPEHHEDEINVKQEFPVYDAVTENETEENHQQIEIKTENEVKNENIEFKPDINNHVKSMLEQQQVEVKIEYVEEDGDQVDNGNKMEHNNEVSYQGCNISRFLKCLSMLK